MPFNSRSCVLLCAILAFALGVRLLAAGWWERRLPAGQKFGFPDSESYWSLAQTVARGEPYEFGARRYQVFRTPGYPVLLAGLFRLVGSDDPPTYYARALGAVLGTITVAGVAALGGLLLGSRGAVIASAIAAVHPEAIAPSVFILSEAPFCPLMMLQLVAWTLAWQAEHRGRQVGWSLLGGMLGGLATLMRPSWLLFLPFAVAAGLLLGPGRAKQVFIGGVMLLGLCCTMLPWWVRNNQVAGRLVPTSLQVGASLYDGLNPQADGGSNMAFVEPGTRELEANEAGQGKTPPGIFEDRIDQHFRDAAIHWARDNPSRVLELAAIKFGRMWNIWPNAGEFSSPRLGIILAIGYLPLIVAAGYGAWLFARRDWPLTLCLLPAAYFTLLHMVFVSSIRYRQPALLPLMVLAAGAVLHVYDKWLRPGDAKATPTPVPGSP